MKQNQKDINVSPRCIPFGGGVSNDGRCIYFGKDAPREVLFAKAYLAHIFV